MLIFCLIVIGVCSIILNFFCFLITHDKNSTSSYDNPFFVIRVSNMKYLIYATALATMLTSAASATDLVEAAKTSGGTKTFASAMKSSGLAKSLEADGPYTIFAPEDSAFDKLPPDTKAALFKDKNKLAQVLAYHVIPGKVMVADVKPGKVKTLEGSSLTLSSDNGKVTVDNANVTQSDVAADNGVIHVIDKVVLPED